MGKSVVVRTNQSINVFLFYILVKLKCISFGMITSEKFIVTKLSYVTQMLTVLSCTLKLKLFYIYMVKDVERRFGTLDFKIDQPLAIGKIKSFLV